MPKNKKTILFVLLILILVGISVLFVYRKFIQNDLQENVDQGISFAEATDAERSETDQNKERVITETEAQDNQTQPNNNQSTNKKSVKPVISYLGQDGSGSEIQANGFVPGIIEKSGTCTLTLTKNGLSVKDSRTSIDNVQDTSCGLFTIPKSKLSNGTWAAVLSYSSSKSSGTSEKISIEVK